MNETSDQLQKAYDRIVEHNEKRLADIRAKIDEREKRGTGHENLDAELAQARATAERGEELALKNLDAALEREKQAQAELNARKKAEADVIEAKRKNAALKAWVRNGGDPSRFEVAYPAIREDLLKSAIMEDARKPEGVFFNSL
jgi:multidrug efflux pump subunit AcrA (membrane-fusion protein)